MQTQSLQDTVSFHTVSKGLWLLSTSVLCNSYSSSVLVWLPASNTELYICSLFSTCVYFNVLVLEQLCLFENKITGKTSLTVNAPGSYDSWLNFCGGSKKRCIRFKNELLNASNKIFLQVYSLCKIRKETLNQLISYYMTIHIFFSTEESTMNNMHFLVFNWLTLVYF